MFTVVPLHYVAPEPLVSAGDIAELTRPDDDTPPDDPPLQFSALDTERVPFKFITNIMDPVTVGGDTTSDSMDVSDWCLIDGLSFMAAMGMLFGCYSVMNSNHSGGDLGIKIAQVLSQYHRRSIKNEIRDEIDNIVMTHPAVIIIIQKLTNMIEQVLHGDAETSQTRDSELSKLIHTQCQGTLGYHLIKFVPHVMKRLTRKSTAAETPPIHLDLFYPAARAAASKPAPA